MSDDVITTALASGEAEALHRLRGSLAEAADRDDLLDVAYRTIDSPVGSLLLAATARGLVRVAFEREDHDRVLASLAGRLSPRILQAPRRLDPVARELDEYFSGGRTAFDVPVDLALTTPFRRRVLEHLPQIRFGSTETYSDVADAVGSPRAVRAVGSACATNPLPVVIPCHRVMRTDGGLGGYLGGLAAKTALLGLESAGVTSR